jgi:hypothetical protein
VRYAFFTLTPDHYGAAGPIVAQSWREIGWTPVGLLIGTKPRFAGPDSIKAEFTLALDWYVPSFPVPDWSHVPQFHMATACRRPSIPLLFKPDDYVLLTDGDMLPIDAAYFEQADMRPGMFTQFFADVWRGQYPPGVTRYPSCYQGATASTWAEICRPKGDTIAEVTWDHMERSHGYEKRFGTNWDCEQGFAYYLDPWIAANPDRFKMIPKGPRLQRLEYVDNPVDAHIRQDWKDEKLWARLPQFAAYREGICSTL